MCYSDGDAADVWYERERRARKRHRCSECDAPIPIGRQYVHVSMLYDGSWDAFAVHVECMELWRFVHDVVCGGKGMIMIGGLSDEIRDGIVDEWNFGYWSDGTGDSDGAEWVNPLLAVYEEIPAAYRAMEAQR